MNKPKLESEVRRGARAAFVITAAGSALALASHVLFARWLGDTQYGVFAYVLSYVEVLIVPATLGLDIAAQRFVPRYLRREETSAARGFFRFSLRATFLVGVGLALGWGLVMWLTRPMGTASFLPAVAIGMVMLPLITAATVVRSHLRALRKVIPSRAPQTLVAPIITLGAAAAFYHGSTSMDAATAAGCKAIGAGVVLVLLLWLMKRFTPEKLRTTEEAEYHRRLWLGAAGWIMAITACHAVRFQLGTIVIGTWLGPEQAGVFKVALQAALPVAFVLHAFNYIAAPKISDLHAGEGRAEVDRMIRGVTPRVFFLTLPVAAGLALFARPILGLFGPTFVEAAPILWILLAGRVVNAAAGPVGSLLIMTGNERAVAGVLAATGVLHIGFTLIGLHLGGLIGAAIAQSVINVVWNTWLAWVAWRRLGINATILRFAFEWLGGRG